MHVRVADVKKWVGRELSVHLSEPWPNIVAERMEGVLSDPAEIDVRVRNLGPALLVEIEGTAKVFTDCVRCLEPTEVLVPFASTEEFKDEPGPSDPFLEYLRYSNDRIELDDIVADLVAVAMPIAPICREECKGLCPQCGTNLNERSCDCVPEADSRWEKLLGFQPNSDGRSR